MNDPRYDIIEYKSEFELEDLMNHLYTHYNKVLDFTEIEKVEGNEGILQIQAKNDLCNHKVIFTNEGFFVDSSHVEVKFKANPHEIMTDKDRGLKEIALIWAGV